MNLEPFQVRLRAYAFGPEFERLAAQLQESLKAHRTQRADIDDRVRLKALSLLAEYLDAVGRAAEAAQLLKLTARELLDSLESWPRELAANELAADLGSTRRLMRQRVWCCCAYAVCLLRANQLTEAAEILERLRAFVDGALEHADFPCNGTVGLLRYYQGVTNRNQGRLNEASLDFDVALDRLQRRWEEKQSKHAGDAERVRREAIYHKVNTARVLGFGHGGIALSRGRYVEARAWMTAAQQILAQSGQEVWRRGLEIYGCCATVLLQEMRPESLAGLRRHVERLTEMAVWFRPRNRRNAVIAEAFAILAEVRIRQIECLAAGMSLMELDIGGLRQRIDFCLREIYRDTGPLSATAALRLIGCLLRAKEWKRCEAELARFQKAFGRQEDALAEFQVLSAELWLDTGRESAARALLNELVEQRPTNRAFRARAWALLAWCEQRVGQTVWAERALAAARESLDHVQDGFTKQMVLEIAARCEQPVAGGLPGMPYQSPADDARWCDMAHNLEMARLNVVEAVYRRYPGYSVEKLAALMGRGPSWLYGFLAEHREVEWVSRLLGRVG